MEPERQPMGAGPVAPRRPANTLASMLAILGAALLLFAGLVPVLGEEFILFVPPGQYELWIWDFLDPFGLVVASIWLALLLLTGRASRFRSGALMGIGLVGVAFYTGYLGFGVAQAAFGLGSAIGILGSGLVLAGGALSAGPPEPRAPVPGLNALLALGGVALIVAGWFIPVVGSGQFEPARRLVAPAGASVSFWLWPFLEPATIVAGALLGLLWGFSRAGVGLTRGFLLGLGVPATLFFLGYVGFGLTVGAFGPGSLIGLAGAGLVLTAGIMPSERSPTPSPAA